MSQQSVAKLLAWRMRLALNYGIVANKLISIMRTLKHKRISIGLTSAATASFIMTGAALADSCDSVDNSGQLKKCVQNNQIVKDLQTIINFLSVGVGVIVIGMIILGGIQYSIAGDNQQATAAAKQRIINALIALMAYLFIFAFLQWLIPGGIFG